MSLSSLLHGIFGGAASVDLAHTKQWYREGVHQSRNAMQVMISSSRMAEKGANAARDAIEGTIQKQEEETGLRRVEIGLLRRLREHGE